MAVSRSDRRSLRAALALGLVVSSELHRQNVPRRGFDQMAVGIVCQDDVLWMTVISYGSVLGRRAPGRAGCRGAEENLS